MHAETPSADLLKSALKTGQVNVNLIRAIKTVTPAKAGAHTTQKITDQNARQSRKFDDPSGFAALPRIYWSAADGLWVPAFAGSQVRQWRA